MYQPDFENIGLMAISGKKLLLQKTLHFRPCALRTSIFHLLAGLNLVKLPIVHETVLLAYRKLLLANHL